MHMSMGTDRTQMREGDVNRAISKMQKEQQKETKELLKVRT
jgi:hypothetical protein